MKKVVKIEDVIMGQGDAKICVPILLNDRIQAKVDAAYVADELTDVVDLVEVRIDYDKEVKNAEKLTDNLKEIKDVLKGIPLLCTFRSFREGGEMQVTEAEYEEILTVCIKSGVVDLLDVELFCGENNFRKLVALAHENGIPVIASSHDFSKTPGKDEIVGRLMQMEREGADIAKIAVMPRDKEDVLILLSATSIANTCMDIPIVTISMGKLGAVSRVSGNLFGSCMTFGVGRKASAPGQIEAKKLREIMQIL